MFSKVIKEGVIPPNFLNSILTNASLYEMFKNDYDANRDYFQGLEREEYLSAMLDFIEKSLFSSNIFNIYSEPDNLEEVTQGKLGYIKNFYDDFLLGEFRIDPDSILKTKFFRGMTFALREDRYASKTQEFMALFEYVFKESLDYDDIVEVLIKEPIRKLEEDEVLSLKEFDILCNYVKNNTDGYVDMSIVTKMLKYHAYKTNHIFDGEVVEKIVYSVAKSYLAQWGIEVEVVFMSGVEVNESTDFNCDPVRIVLDEKLVDSFLSLNYTEVFTELFFEADKIRDYVLLKRNEINYNTIKAIMVLVTNRVDLTKIGSCEAYMSSEYLLDLRTSSFVKTLRFFSSFGVNLFQNFISSEVSKLDFVFDEQIEEVYSQKEISLDQRFFLIFKKVDHKKNIIKQFKVLDILFDNMGNRIKTIDLIKKLYKTEHRDFLEEYLHSRIADPETMIEDVIDLAGYKSKDKNVREFIERELKYIYVDSFYYSLDSHLKLHTGQRFNKEDYLMDLSVKINCIKDTPLTHRFIDEALFTVEEKQQSVW